MPGLEKGVLVEFTHETPEKLHPRDVNARKRLKSLQAIMRY